MSSKEEFFVTNEYLNSMFPLANLPRGSMDDDVGNDWYIKELSRRYLGALFIGDKLTMQQIQDRLNIHRIVQDAHA